MFLSVSAESHFHPGFPDRSTHCLVKLSFDVSGACECRGVQAPGMGCPTKQSFFHMLILDFIAAQVCSLVYNSLFSFLLRNSNRRNAASAPGIRLTVSCLNSYASTILVGGAIGAGALLTTEVQRSSSWRSSRAQTQRSSDARLASDRLCAMRGLRLLPFGE